MRQPESATSNWNGDQRRSVSEILKRRKRQMKQQRRMFPPDFIHGDVAVGEIYEVLGRRWAERALFAVDDGEVTTVAYFDDYFLVIEQWSADHGLSWKPWWKEQRGNRDRVVTLDVNDDSRLSDEATVPIEVGRRRLRELEQGLLGVAREGMSAAAADGNRDCQGELDVLSLVTLVSQLFDEHAAAGA